jgi:hypothetical protein
MKIKTNIRAGYINVDSDGGGFVSLGGGRCAYRRVAL